ncbi:uncharacterized protein V6R79_008212 [Siganus canaliculatus]
MNANRLSLLLALWFACTSSNDLLEDSCMDSDVCETVTLHVSLGSSVLLPCHFAQNKSDRLSWVHSTGMNERVLAKLTSDGRVQFVNPRYGRVKAFPNQCSEGNYSIRIDDLENTDLGCYRCKQKEDCVQVELLGSAGDKNEKEETLLMLLIYVVIGLAAFIVLTVGGYCCVKCIKYFRNQAQASINSPVGAGASAPPEERGVSAVSFQRSAINNGVYENDIQNLGPPGLQSGLDSTQPGPSTTSVYPDLNQFNPERVTSQKRKQRFHTEFFSRLRQASLSRHFYVNQAEIRRQQAMAARAERNHRGDNRENNRNENNYPNPIYNRSTDNLNHMYNNHGQHF